MPRVIAMCKVNANGQVCLPKALRVAMGVREGDSVLFVRADGGDVLLYRSDMEPAAVPLASVPLSPWQREEERARAREEFLELILQQRRGEEVDPARMEEVVYRM